MKKVFLLTITMLLSMVLSVRAQGAYSYDPQSYDVRTSIFLTFIDAKGQVINDPSWEVYAFIDGECRAQATPVYDRSQALSAFHLMVGGEDGRTGAASEMGHAITLRVVVPNPQTPDGSGFEYRIEPAQPLFTFKGDDSYGLPTDPVKVTFDPLQDIQILSPQTIHRGSTVDPSKQFVENPDDRIVPQIVWTLEERAKSYLKLEGNLLTGVAVTPVDGVIVNWDCGALSGEVMVKVDAPATNFVWKEDYASGQPLIGQITVPVGENGNDTRLALAVQNGWTLVPDDATTTFDPADWESSNPRVVSNERGNFSVYTKGTATLTGHASDDCGLSPQLNVTVVQPVLRISLNTREIYAVVGSDITDLLNKIKAAATVAPEDADNPALKWVVDGEYVTVNSQGRYIASKVTENIPEPTGAIVSYVNIQLAAADGWDFAMPQNLIVRIIEAPVSDIAAVKPTLNLKYSGAEIDVTDQIFGNIKVTPDSYTMNDLLSNQTVWYSFQDANVGDVAGVVPESTVLRQDDYTHLTLIGSGECVFTVQGRTQVIDENGQLVPKNLEAQFNIVVSDGIRGFEFDAVYMAKEDMASITVRPNPADATDFDASRIRLVVEADAERPMLSIPKDWKTIEVERDLSQPTGMEWDVKAYSLGSFNVNIYLDDELMGSGTVNVVQRLHLKDGWQWMALQQGSIEGPEKVFGDNLSEIRSDYEMVVNDPNLEGYWGDIYIDTRNTYKIKMALPESMNEFVADITSECDYLEIMSNDMNSEYGVNANESQKGWNWVGNPYQYWHSVNTVFAPMATFTDGDYVKTKTQFATFKDGKWTPDFNLEPGQGMIVYCQDDGFLGFNSEFGMEQTDANVASARRVSVAPELWKVDDSRFADNMAMVAYVGAVADPSRVTLWAFVGDECRGRSVSVGDRQFITVHGTPGERVTFKVYDEVYGELREVLGSRPFMAISGSIDAPVSLYPGKEITAIDGVTELKNGNATVYDLQGRRVENARKGLFIQNGRKVVK